MYPYHNKIKQRIKRGEMVAFEFVNDYPGIGEALVLKFNTEPFIRPIRPHKYVEYVDILAAWNKANETGGLECLKRLLNTNFPEDIQIELEYESPSKS